MKNKVNEFKALESDLKLAASSKDSANKHFIFISDLYQVRFRISESEDRIMLDKLLAATQGKELVFAGNGGESV